MNTHTKTIAKEKARENNLWLMFFAIVLLTLFVSSNVYADDILSGFANFLYDTAKDSFGSLASILVVVAAITWAYSRVTAIGILIATFVIGIILYGKDIIVAIAQASA